MYTDFDEMDIEPKSESSSVQKSLFDVDSLPKNEKSFDEELQNQLLLRTVPLDDGNIGYVFTCTKNGPLATWRCHACNFVDSWKSLVKHMESSWHHDSMSKFQHSRSNFSKVENAIPDISKGQPLPPGMEDIIAGPCQIAKTLENYDHPLIGLEFLLELNMIELKEPRYLCLLCDKRGDPRSIMVHLTSQSHYLIYLRKYFKSFYALIDKLPKSNECRGNVSTVTSHLIAKLEEKYGRLQPTATREDVINVPEQRTIILQKIDSGIHFTETPEDRYLEEMLTIEYVQNTSLLLKNFPLKPKLIDKSKFEDKSKNLFHKGRANKKHLRNRNIHDMDHEKSPEVLFVSSGKPKERRSRETSPRSGRSRRSRSSDYYRRRHSPSYYRSVRHRSRSRSPRRHRSRSPHDRYRPKSPYRSSHSSRYGYRHRIPERHYRRSPSPNIKDIYGKGYRGRSSSRSGRSKEQSPHHKSKKSRSPSTLIPAVSELADKKLHLNQDGVNNKHKEKKKYEESNFQFLKEFKDIQEKLSKELEHYSETPENHPAYQEEWKKFWCNRFKELQLEGKIDPHTYDYKPEWISFWNIRVKELFNEELEKQKKTLKTKYGLSEDNGLLELLRKEENSTVDEKKPVIDIKTMWKELTGFEIREEPTKKCISPWEDDNDEDIRSKNTSKKVEAGKEKLDNNIENDTQPISPEPLSSISDSESRSRSTPRRSYSRGRSDSRSRSRSRSKTRSFSRDRTGFKEDYHRKPSKKIHFDNPLNIITVLRQLSVLEFQLGSYASHVISLLSSGLAMERIKPQSSVDLLTKENIIFLELVKEKLKGQLLAGVVQKSMVKATLFCIKNIEELLLVVPKIKSVAPPPVPAPPPGLLYGAGVDPMTTATTSLAYSHPPPAPTTHSHAYHTYGMSSYKSGPGPGPKSYDREYGKYNKMEYPFRKSPQRKMESNDSDKYHRSTAPRFPFSSGKTEYPFAEEKKKDPSADEEIPIDKVLIAKQIAEVLTAQGRTDVSEEELQTLINTVVENLKQEQKGQGPAAVAKSLDSLFSKGTPPVPQLSSVVIDEPIFPNTNDNVVTIPAGFNLNEVSSSTLAILQDAYANVSNVTNNKPFCIEDLSESDLIQLLRNFKNVPRFKQEKLIEYLRKLEETNPERVEELKKYVNVL